MEPVNGPGPALGGMRLVQTLVHTGQHYDSGLSGVSFDQLCLPASDYHLGVGSGSHAVQTAHALERLEPVPVQERPDLVMVVGDVNSTLAAALHARSSASLSRMWRPACAAMTGACRGAQPGWSRTSWRTCCSRLRPAQPRI